MKRSETTGKRTARASEVRRGRRTARRKGTPGKRRTVTKRTKRARSSEKVRSVCEENGLKLMREKGNGKGKQRRIEPLTNKLPRIMVIGEI
jgi:hypothetical protein